MGIGRVNPYKTAADDMKGGMTTGRSSQKPPRLRGASLQQGPSTFSTKIAPGTQPAQHVQLRISKLADKMHASSEGLF